MSDHRQQLRVKETGDVTVVHLTNRKILDEVLIREIGEQLFGLADNLGQRKMLLDLRNVEYLSSAAIGTLITLNKKVHDAGGRLALCNIDPQIYEVFEITKAHKLLKIERDPNDDDQAGVVARLQPPKPSGGGSVALQPPPPE